MISIKKFIIVSLLFVSACASRGSGTQIMYEKDGKTVYRTMCSGDFSDMSDCYAYAYSICQSDYETIKEFDQSTMRSNEININNNISIGSYPNNNRSGFQAFMDGFNSQKPKSIRYLIFSCKQNESHK